jgi:hypothetical protein
MSSIFLNFDGTPTEAVEVGENNVYELNVGVPVYTSDKVFGTSSIRTGSSSNVDNIRFRVDLGDISGDHYGSIYLRNNTAHGSGSSYCSFFHLVTSTGVWIAEMRCGPSNGFSIRSSNVEVRSAGVNEIPVNAWFRLDWRNTASTFYWRLFSDPNGTTPTLSGSYSTSAITTPAQTLMLGAYSNNSALVKDWSFDLVRASDTEADWYGPYSESTPTAGVTVWDGAQELEVVSIGVWDGTTEQPASFDVIA